LPVVVSLYRRRAERSQFPAELSGFQQVIGLLLAGSLAMSSAGSFRRERESGVMELLLVSADERAPDDRRPAARDLSQFLPSFGLFLGILGLPFHLVVAARRFPVRIFFFGNDVCHAAVIGLYTHYAVAISLSLCWRPWPWFCSSRRVYQSC